MNPLTGEEIEKKTYTFPIHSIIKLPQHTPQGVHPLLLIDHNLKVHLFGDIDLFESIKHSVYFYIINTTEGTISGYGMSNKVRN